MARARSELWQTLLAPIACILTNAHRDAEKHPQPIPLWRFLPNGRPPRRKGQRKSPELSTWLNQFPESKK